MVWLSNSCTSSRNGGICAARYSAESLLTVASKLARSVRRPLDPLKEWRVRANLPLRRGRATDHGDTARATSRLGCPSVGVPPRQLAQGFPRGSIRLRSRLPGPWVSLRDHTELIATAVCRSLMARLTIWPDSLAEGGHNFPGEGAHPGYEVFNSRAEVGADMLGTSVPEGYDFREDRIRVADE